MKKKDSDLKKELERYSKRSLEKLKYKKEIKYNKRKNSIVDKPYNEIYYKLIRKRRNNNFEVLEICCGEGECSEPIFKNFKNIIFTDISEFSLEVMRIKFSNYLRKSIKFKECNMEVLPFDENQFDIVFCAGGLSYGDNHKVLNEIYRVLKNKGKFIAIDSLNENPIYKFNRYLHYLRGNRTLSTLKRMPNFKLIKNYKKKFGSLSIYFSGSLIWLIQPLSRIIGHSNASNISEFLDNLLPKWMSFKFVMEVKKVK